MFHIIIVFLVETIMKTSSGDIYDVYWDIVKREEKMESIFM